MSGRFRFGEFELDVDAYALWRGGAPVRLEKTPMDLLILLVEHAGILVERRTIHAALWGPDVFIERDAAINTAIRKIRQALADNAAKPSLIETVVAKGYRFTPSVEQVGGAADRRSTGSRNRPAFPTYCVMRGARQFPLDPGDNDLGRDGRVSVCIDHPSVSRRHARISIRPNHVLIEDLGSRNGTYVNGRRIDTATEIEDGAVIGLGPILVTFTVVTGSASTRSISGYRR